MIGFLLGYGVARSAARSRARRATRPPGYEEFEIMVLVSAMIVGAGWPIHLGVILTRWGLHVVASILIATIAGVVALATGVGYVLIGVVYAGVWLAVLIDRGTRAEQGLDEQSRQGHGYRDEWEAHR